MIKIKRLESLGKLKDFDISEKKLPFFQSVFYLEVFTNHFCKSNDLLILGVFSGNELVGYGGFEVVGQKVLLLGMKQVLGEEEVTDYGDVVISEDIDWGEAWVKILEWFVSNGNGVICLDYVRSDSATLKIFSEKKNSFKDIKIKISEQEVAPYIKLANSWDEYLVGLNHKRRKEIKRKIKRLEETSAFHFCSEATARKDFEEFVRLHRHSDIDKKKFMSDKMKAFFWDLISGKKIGWEASLCFLKIEDKNVASVLSFEDENNVLLYNSGYDPGFDFYSVGFLLKAFKIKDAIKKSKKIYDFMRGDERYKYDLGGVDLKLSKVEIEFP